MRVLFLDHPNAWLRFHDLPGRETAYVYLHGPGSAAAADFPALVTEPALAGRREILVNLLSFGFCDRP